VKGVRRYLGLLAVQFKASALLSLQYRSDFVLDGIIEVFWTTTAIIPLFVIYGVRHSVAGWGFGESLLVVGWFTLLQGVLEGAINPSLSNVVEQVRKGTLDFVLIKPADAQFLVSTARFQPWRAVNVLTALALFVYAFTRLGRAPGALDVGAALTMLGASVVVLYSLWILTVSAVFYVVRIDNLTHLFTSVFDAARWPSAFFRGVLRWIFTFVIPLALMTTYPAEALLGTLGARTLFSSVLGAALFAWAARAVWQRSIGRYTSAA
jgi:ABC-2 type transport system permease protein